MEKRFKKIVSCLICFAVLIAGVPIQVSAKDAEVTEAEQAYVTQEEEQAVATEVDATPVLVDSNVTYIGDFAAQNNAGITGIINVAKTSKKDAVSTIKTLANSSEIYGVQNSILNSVNSSVYNEIIGEASVSGNVWYVYECFSDEAHTASLGIYILPKSVNVKNPVTVPAKVTVNSAEYNVTALGDNAFEGSTVLSKVTFEDGLYNIGNNAFKDCTALNDVDFTKINTLSVIGDFAFSNTALVNVKLPKVSYICQQAFSYCTQLESILLPTNSEFKEVAYRLFIGCIKLKGIVIPNNVQAVGTQAFMDCTALESATLSTNNAYNSLNYQLFCNCTSLKAIVVPSNIVIIENEVFMNCTSLKDVTLNDGLSAVGGRAFYNTASIESITVPTTLSALGWQAFYGSGVKKLTFGATSALNFINYNGNYEATEVFAECRRLESVDWANCTFTNSGFTRIPWKTFYNCNSLKSIVVPSQIVSVASECFNGCTSLTSADLAQVQSVEYKAFYNCNFAELVLPKTVTSVGSQTFGVNSNLKKVTFNCSVATWTGYPQTQAFVVFADNNWSNNIETIIIDNAETDTTVVGSGFCYNMPNLKSVTISDNIKVLDYQCFGFCPKLERCKLPSELVTIGQNAFIYDYALNNIDLPNTVKTIGTSAYLQCSSIDEIIIPDSVESIGYSAFYRCLSVKNLEIPASVKSIGSSAFQGFRDLQTAYIDCSYNAICGTSWQGCIFQMLYESADLKTEEDNGDELEAPVDPQYFHTLKIGPNMDKLGVNTFYGMTVNTIEFDQNSKITAIPENCFQQCSRLTKVVLPPNIESIGQRAFYGCWRLPTVDLPQSVKTIGENAFMHCIKLDNITLPDNLERISDCAFYNCFSLSEITIPENVKYLGQSAFRDNVSLKSITINSPDVFSIDYNGFLTQSVFRTQSPVYVSIYDDASKWQTSKYYGTEYYNYYSSRESINFEDACKDLIAKSILDNNGNINQDNLQLDTVTFGKKVEKLRREECYGMNMKKLIFEHGGVMTEIAPVSFQNCDRLEYIDFGTSITTIGDCAFYECDALKEVFLPSNISKLSHAVFQLDRNLKDIYILNPHLTLAAEDFQPQDDKLNDPTEPSGAAYSATGYQSYGYQSMAVTVVPMSSISKTFDIIVTDGSDNNQSISSQELNKTVTFTDLDTTSVQEFKLTESISDSNCTYHILNTHVEQYGPTEFKYVVVVGIQEKGASEYTIPMHTNIWAYRYTTDDYDTPGYIPCTDKGEYTETLMKKYHEYYAGRRETQHNAHFYPLDEVISIDAVYNKDFIYAGDEIPASDIEVTAERRDEAILSGEYLLREDLSKRLANNDFEFEITNHTTDYDSSDRTIGMRDITVTYLCPVSLKEDNAVNDIVKVNVVEATTKAPIIKDNNYVISLEAGKIEYDTLDKIYYRVNGGDWTEYAKPFKVYGRFKVEAYQTTAARHLVSDIAVYSGVEYPDGITAEYIGDDKKIDEKVPKDEIVVTVHYPNSEDKVVTDFDLINDIIKKLGDNDVTVSYKEYPDDDKCPTLKANVTVNGIIRAVTLQIKLTYDDGTPIANKKVLFTSDNTSYFSMMPVYLGTTIDGVFTATTDDDGNLTMESIPVGGYKVSILDDDDTILTDCEMIVADEGAEDGDAINLVEAAANANVKSSISSNIFNIDVKLSKAPATGDNSNAMFILLVMLASIALIILLADKRELSKRINKRERIINR